MNSLPGWSTRLTIRQKFQVLGAGMVLPFLLTLTLAAFLYQSVTAEVGQTLALSRQGDEALVSGVKIDSLLLIQSSLQTLAQKSGSPVVAGGDVGVEEEAAGLFRSAEAEWAGLDPAHFGPLRQTWDRFRRGFQEERPRLVAERASVFQTFEDRFQKLEGLTLYYQDRLDDLAIREALLAQTRAFFAVLMVLHGRNGPYLDDRALGEWKSARQAWIDRFPTSGVYRTLALEYLKTIDEELVPTLEAWISERNRVELGLLRLSRNQDRYSTEVITKLSAEKQRSLESIRVGLSERSRSQASLQSQGLVWLLVLAATGLLGGVALFFLLRAFERGLIAPLTQMTEWASRIVSGDYDARLSLDRSDEIGVLNRSLEHMTLEVLRKNREVEEVNRSLEATVVQRTDHLAQALRNLEAAQAKLVLSEKLSLLGTLAASMAHELNTPLGAIVSGTSSIRRFLEEELLQAQERYDRLSSEEREAVVRWIRQSIQTPLESSSRHRYAEVKELEALLRSWGSSGPEAQAEIWFELGLGQAHDQQRPWATAPRVTEMLQLTLEVSNLFRMTRVISTAAEQAGRVVQSLQHYIQKDNLDGPSWFNLKESLTTALELLGTRRLREVEVRWTFAPHLSVHGPMGELVQIWLNLVTNALQAMEYRGVLSLEAEPWSEGWRVGIRDTGPGIPPEIGERVFEPFYSSKKEQGGMGLGLDICRRALVAIGGSLTYSSSPGNTVFQVYWPRGSGTTEPVDGKSLPR